MLKKDDFLPIQQEILLGIFDLVRTHSSGPAWPVLNTIGEDARAWQGEDQLKLGVHNESLGDVRSTQDFDLERRL